MRPLIAALLLSACVTDSEPAPGLPAAVAGLPTDSTVARSRRRAAETPAGRATATSSPSAEPIAADLASRPGRPPSPAGERGRTGPTPAPTSAAGADPPAECLLDLPRLERLE